VVLRYQPWSFRVGAVLSLLGWVIIGAALLRRR
jgi:hypothetical protein